MRKKLIRLLTLLTACFLTGCSFRTVDQMYCLPKRPESYNNLQSVMDTAMIDHEYCAPLSGENQQTVQMADLNGDGIHEYLLFSKSNSEKPLQIFIFRQDDETFVLADVIESTGSAYDLVEYVQMDGIAGVELVVGRQVSDQVVRSLSVYRFSGGQMEQMLTTNYSKFLTCDMDTDGMHELMVLRPGQTDTDKGVAELFSFKSGVVQRTNEASMSEPVDKLKRIIIGNLHTGIPAVFVGSAVEESAIITDVYALVDGQFRNISFSNESGTSVNTLRNYYVYADDIDSDGEVELPSLISMTPLEQGRASEQQYLIRWYSMDPDGREIDKLYTYHNYVGGWYMTLDPQLASRICVQQETNQFKFYLWNSEYSNAEELFSVYVLTGNNRQEQLTQDDQFVLHQGESTIYAAQLHDAAKQMGMTWEELIRSFCLIHQDWNTGEM